ncbi:DEAD/DEAH box helicase family protein [Paenarthrobacter sp. MSM-2-10-13]|uniref:DEAD/DEAH box helicase family protein n=1 Tax=Paenarthrobacter sp. MSM-2-10-13 TaxID=2717318 RepID=UPI00141FF5EF|nr:DEAD/DEAH box helicase family protein [Paenarthrobacter sp. MSM-2-10-13]NHW45953.1 DEAD/DEAH box helicase family protein [Paenarthrobacter sp. MSM-2-10-13]
MTVVGPGNFPLAVALRDVVGSQIADIAQGQPTALMDEVTPVTAELLKFWFQDDYVRLRNVNFHDGQREAILHVIYAHEVLKAPNLAALYRELATEALLDGDILGDVTRPSNNHPKYAAKMATGTGKTWVLNALLVWQYLNHKEYPEDERFTSNFLVVAPGLIVYDRLLDSFLGKERNGVRDFETSDIFLNQDIFIPDNYRESVFGFVQSSVATKEEIGSKVTGNGVIAIANWHLLAGVEDPDFVGDDDDVPGAAIDAKAAIDSFFPVRPGTTAGNSLSSLDRKFTRGGPLEWLKDLPALMTFNDEAHHIHSIKKGQQVSEVEWQKSLTEIASTKGRRFIQVDFSATPYNETGTGAKKGRKWFPHIVVDFDLKQAMAQGLVKSLALDRRKEIATMPLDFNAERDSKNRVIGLSSGQRVMIRAGLTKLAMLEEKFEGVDPNKHPKLMVICEETSVTRFVESFLLAEGLAAEDVLVIDSDRKGELSKPEWDAARERLFDVDRHKSPKVIVSVLMLREGFDVNNISVIVPLRANTSGILLEQTIGRGLRLMWRGDEQIDEMKQENRRRIAQRLEPDNYFDVLFVVEHPAFTQFYDELMEAGLAGTVGDDTNGGSTATGDLEVIGLREGYEAFDFHIPMMVRDREEEITAPMLDPYQLPRSRVEFAEAKRIVGLGDRFVSEDAQTKTQFGDYRVNGGVMTATGYNDFLSRMTIRIAEALGGRRASMTSSPKKYSDLSEYPLLQMYRPQLLGWIDTYIRHRFFDMEFNPLEEENWRILLWDAVTNDLAGNVATALVEALNQEVVAVAEVLHRSLSEVSSISIRTSSCVSMTKCIYPKLPVPTHGGGLERKFLEWSEKDTYVEAICKISEYKHTYVQRPYLKADGMPARYSPDFLVRTESMIYVVETKADSDLSNINVQRKQAAAIAWCDQINELEPSQRGHRRWAYVLLAEQTVLGSIAANERASDLLDRSRLRSAEEEEAAQQIW